MRYDKVLSEELEIDTEIDSINKNFHKYIEQVFSSVYLKKIDRVFKKPILIREFKEKSNVMAVTIGDQIKVNVKMFNELPVDRQFVYIVHEFLHVLQNFPQFEEVRTVNRILKKKTLSKIPVQKLPEFLTGKPQDIHSNASEEFLTYCSNFAFNWKLAPELKQEYYDTLSNSGIFNMNSNFWKKRFS